MWNLQRWMERLSMTVKVNSEKSRIAVKRLHNTFSTVDSLHKATISLPEGLEWGSREHFLYLFYGCLLDYGMKSSFYHKNLKNAYKEKPELFEPVYIVETFQKHVQDLAVFLKDFVRIRFPNEGARRWLSLSEILMKKYNGDPRNIFKPFMSFNSVKKAVFNIKGFGQKTGGLLIRILYENDLIEIQDNISHIPIDRHDIEISINLGILEENCSENRKNSAIVEQLSLIWVRASQMEHVDPCETDRNLWLLGSLLCSKKKCAQCPLDDMCKQSSKGGF